MPSLKDLVKHALEEQPTNFKNTFDELMTNRILDIVDARKDEIASSMFGEASDEDEDFDDLDLDLDDITDEDLEDLDIDDILTDDDEDELSDEDDEIEESSFEQENLDALKEENNTHYFDHQETRNTSNGLALGVRSHATGKITGYLHVGPKVDASGKKSMFGQYNRMRYSKIGTRGTAGMGQDHELGVQKFNGSSLQKQISDIHAKG